ncbi:MAG: FecR domain-containing protein [Anaerolineales bacterium]|nr:FecR domain-containing protein [Anaerolineales bacterium]
MKYLAYRFSLILIIGMLAGCTAVSTPASPTATAILVPVQSPTATTIPSPTLPPPPTDTPTPVPTPTGAQAIIADLINQVDAHPLPEGTWEQAQFEMVVYQGGEVWAKEASTARLRLDEELVRVAPNTIFTFQQPDDQTLQINLQEGQMWLNVTGLEAGETLQVETPSAVASVRGTRFSVRVDKDGRTVVSVAEGNVILASNFFTQTINAGHQSTVLPGQPPAVPETMSTAERLAWGMADGPNLDIILPAASSYYTSTQKGQVFNGSWSHDSKMITYITYDPSDKSKSSGSVFYDIQTGSFVSMGPPEATDTFAKGAVFNPTGPGIAYYHYDQETGPTICTLWTTSDHSTPTCIGGDQSYYGYPIWSPDGQWLLFYSDRQAKASWLAERLISSWSPRFYPFSQAAEPILNLWKVHPDGSDLTQLTKTVSGVNHRQSWSQDSKLIAYVHIPNYETKTGELWVMEADGSKSYNISDRADDRGTATIAWSPDSQWLAYPENDDGLWITHPDGSELHRLAKMGEGTFSYVSWSPSKTGWPLLYLFNNYEETHLCYVLSDGAEPVKIGPVTWGPIWSPNGSQMAIGLENIMDAEQLIFESRLYFFSMYDNLWP